MIQALRTTDQMKYSDIFTQKFASPYNFHQIELWVSITSEVA